MGWIISGLEYFGITKETVTPFVIFGVIFYFILKKSSLTPIKKCINKITNAIMEIQTIFKQGGVSLTHVLTEKSGSPLKVSVFGANLIKESGLEKILDDNKISLIEKVKKSLPSNYSPYDVQEKSRQALLALKENEMMKPVKDYAFENSLLVESILNPAGLWLRDDFLNEPRGILK